MCDEEDLQAYVEGTLSPARRRLIERYLGANPDEAERIAGYRAQKAALLTEFGRWSWDSTSDDVERLASALSGKLQRHQQIRGGIRAAGFACVILAAVGGGWLGRGVMEDRTATFASVIAQQAAQGYRLYAGSDGFAAQTASPQGADPFGWLTQRSAGQPSVVPDLKALGFDLAGGWIFPTQYGNAVQLLYLNDAGEDVTLYIAYGGSPLPEAFSYAQNDDISLLFWQSGDVGYCLAGRFERTAMVAMADVVAAQLKRQATSDTLESAPLPAPAPGQTRPISKEGTVQTIPLVEPPAAGDTMTTPRGEAAPSGNGSPAGESTPAATSAATQQKS